MIETHEVPKLAPFLTLIQDGHQKIIPEGAWDPYLGAQLDGL